MILLHAILIRCISITITLILFSCNVYGVHHNNKPLFTSTKIHYNTSHTLSTSVKSHIKNKTCVYNEINIATINTLIHSPTSQKQYDQLHSFVLKAIHHPADCLLTHDLYKVGAFFTAASVCEDYSSIEVLAGNLVKGDITITNDAWSYMDMWKISSALFTCTNPNAMHLREIIANNIVSPNNDMSKWQPDSFIYVLISLVKDSSTKEKEAVEKILAYILTKKCNIEKWGGHKLSLLFRSLSKANVESADMAMIKVLNIIIKSGLSYWNIHSTSIIFKSLAILQEKHKTNVVNKEISTKVIKLIMDYLSDPKTKFTDLNYGTIAPLMNALWLIHNLIDPDKIRVVRHKLAKVIISKSTHASPIKSNDWMKMACGLDNKFNIEQEAIRALADCLNDKKIDLSECTKIELLNILVSFASQNGFRIEKAMRKIAEFVSKANLDSWDNHELAITAELLSSKIRDFHHNAINNIACQILHKSKKSLVDDYIDISITLSRGRGDSCLALIRKIANEVSDDSFDISSRSPVFLSKLVRILSNDDTSRDVEKAINKIVDCCIYKNAEQLLSIHTDALKVLVSGLCKHYKLRAARRFIWHICGIILDESTDLSDWPIATMDVLLRTLSSTYQDETIQRAFRKIVATLHLPNTELQKWSVQTIARVAKGVSRFRDYSSEEFIAQLANIYMEKRDYNESRYGIMILSAICHLPIASSKIIKSAVKLASSLYNDTYSNMNKAHQLTLFWGITLLNFVVHEEWKKANTHRRTKYIITELTKKIPEIDQNTINQQPVFPTDWQLELMNIMHSYHPRRLNNIHLLKNDNKVESDSCSELENTIYNWIKDSIPGLRIDTTYSLSEFPIDLLLRSKSRSKCLLVEVDGPQHYFKKDNSNRLYRVAKDRFIDFVLDEQLGYKVMRINYQESRDYEYRKQFIQQILAIFPNHTH
ncbi:MAG: RAP domain-containing protein [Candidatus Endonucleobacter bathymodioli]|uniref:RAP domain-containing protein n=1 Tax=Candidatus Endonucleibacter bathymodioli TaxID=539814 RepID=A0AA90NXZ2_9GAMM|nr:RAP domain-containing protein [Candidatus Endonucleobacter bathymodioli]